VQPGPPLACSHSITIIYHGSLCKGGAEFRAMRGQHVPVAHIRMHKLAMQDAVGSDDEAQEALSEFTALFAAYRYGHYSLAVTRNLAVNLLNDCAPTTIEEFLSLCAQCALSDVWAGVVSPGTAQQDLEMASGQLLAASQLISGEGGLEAGAGRGVEGGRVSIAADAASRTGRSWRSRRESHAGVGGGGGPRAPKAKDWLHIAKGLVPYGRGTYAVWFTIINMAVIVGLFAYMAGDYAMWAARHTSAFEAATGSSGAAYLQARSCASQRCFFALAACWCPAHCACMKSQRRGRTTVQPCTSTFGAHYCCTLCSP
jgi:hypothetical protein